MPIHNDTEGDPMTKIFFLCSILFAAAGARENPFFVNNAALSLPVTSNTPDNLPRLTALPYNVPNQARILKEVSFTIQNLDGSIETKTMKIDRSIDWHAPLMVSQSAHAVSAESPIKASGNAKSAVADFGFVRFETNGKRLTIKSNDPIIRHFALTDPNQIIIDFKRSAIFTTKEKKLNTPPYASVTVANHGKFARATIVLDGRYDYSLNKNSGVITLTCR